MDFTAHASLECLKTPSMRTEHRDGTKQTEAYFVVEWKLLCSGTRLVSTGSWPSGERGTRTRISHLPIYLQIKDSRYIDLCTRWGTGRGQPWAATLPTGMAGSPASIWKSLREKIEWLRLPTHSSGQSMSPMLVACLPWWLKWGRRPPRNRVPGRLWTNTVYWPHRFPFWVCEQCL